MWKNIAWNAHTLACDKCLSYLYLCFASLLPLIWKFLLLFLIFAANNGEIRAVVEQEFDFSYKPGRAVEKNAHYQVMDWERLEISTNDLIFKNLKLFRSSQEGVTLWF